MIKGLAFIFISSITVSQVHASLFRSDSLWKKNTLSICFAEKTKELVKVKSGFGKYNFYNKSFSPSEKLKLKSWVLENYSLEKTNITFSGFESCTDKKSADVIIYFLSYDLQENYYQTREGFASIGAEGKSNLFPEASGYVVFDRIFPKKEIVVHEFGHLVGLAHEHNRPEMKNEECYKRIYEKTPIVSYEVFLSQREVKDNQFVALGDFDIQSIMNTCHLRKIRVESIPEAEIGLSTNDALLLRELYKNLPN